MRKFLFVLPLLAISFAGYSQSVKIKYQGDVQAGYSIGIGTFNHDRVNLHMINSVCIGDYFSAGVGLGLDMFTKLHYDEYDGTNWYEESSPELTLPIYFNARGYLPVTNKTELFLSMDIGASIGLTEGVDGLSGLLFVPSVGSRFKVGSKNAVSVSLGYVLQKWSEAGFHINTDAIQLKLGFSF